uniref:Secreted protein n=1 Tax=Ascaris lumbricoides TaxID=6252 RepID=A0A0M3HGY2_ASCLU
MNETIQVLDGSHCCCQLNGLRFLQVPTALTFMNLTRKVLPTQVSSHFGNGFVARLSLLRNIHLIMAFGKVPPGNRGAMKSVNNCNLFLKVPVSNAFRTVSNVGCFVALTFYLLCSKKLASQIQRPLLTSILHLYSSLVDMKYNNTTITDHVILLLRCRFPENSLPPIFRHANHHVRQRYESCVSTRWYPKTATFQKFPIHYSLM